MTVKSSSCSIPECRDTCLYSNRNHLWWHRQSSTENMRILLCPACTLQVPIPSEFGAHPFVVPSVQKYGAPPVTTVGVDPSVRHLSVTKGHPAFKPHLQTWLVSLRMALTSKPLSRQCMIQCSVRPHCSCHRPFHHIIPYKAPNDQLIHVTCICPR